MCRRDIWQIACPLGWAFREGERRKGQRKVLEEPPRIRQQDAWRGIEMVI